MMILSIGEILYDVFPDSKILGGAPFNVAYNLKKLGMDTRFVSRVGEDKNGKEICREIQSHGFNPGDIQIDSAHKTGLVAIEIDNQGIPTYEIRKNAAYDFIRFTNKIEKILKIPPVMIYFGTLVQRTKEGMDNIQTLLLHRHADTKCMLDINLRKGHISKAAIFESLLNTHYLKLNESELEEIGRIFGPLKNRDQLLRHLFQQFPLESIALTLGQDGGILYNSTSEFRYHQKPIESIIDTVGAGDAFASVFAIGCLKGWSLEKIGNLASAFAAEICQIPGAIISNTDLFKQYKELINS